MTSPGALWAWLAGKTIKMSYLSSWAPWPFSASFPSILSISTLNLSFKVYSVNCSCSSLLSSISSYYIIEGVLLLFLILFYSLLFNLPLTCKFDLFYFGFVSLLFWSFESCNYGLFALSRAVLNPSFSLESIMSSRSNVSLILPKYKSSRSSLAPTYLILLKAFALLASCL